MIEDFLKANNLSAKLVFCSKRVATSQQAANFMNVTLDDIGKSLLFILDNGDPILVFIQGSKKASVQKLLKISGAKEARMATPAEVLEITGYYVGAVPPISVYGVPLLIDKGLENREKIICGGGSDQHVLSISFAELLEFAFEPKIEDISL